MTNWIDYSEMPLQAPKTYPSFRGVQVRLLINGEHKDVVIISLIAIEDEDDVLARVAEAVEYSFGEGSTFKWTSMEYGTFCPTGHAASPNGWDYWAS